MKLRGVGEVVATIVTEDQVRTVLGDGKVERGLGAGANDKWLGTGMFSRCPTSWRGVYETGPLSS